MTFIDTNILIDVFEHDRMWFEWSAMQLASAAAGGHVRINAIVVAELSRNFDTWHGLHAKLDRLSLVSLPLDEKSAFMAGKRFQEYRRVRNRDDARVLPDFLIGAHAVTLGVSLLTRDPHLYRRYFPELPLIIPETNHG